MRIQRIMIAVCLIGGCDTTSPSDAGRDAPSADTVMVATDGADTSAPLDVDPTGTPLAVFDPTPPEYWYVDALPFEVGVAGENVTEYRFRIDGGDFGEPRPVGEPIVLEHVRPGLRTIEIEGRNAAGTWQASPTAASFHMITLEHEDIACDEASCDLIIAATAGEAFYHPDDADRFGWEIPATLGPGATVCLAAGTHGRRGLRGFSGSAAEPIRIVNCGGVARLVHGAGGGGAAFSLDGLDHVALVGVGDVESERGIVLVGSASGAHGVGIGGGTTHVEVAFVDIERADNHGIDAKSDSTTADMCRFGRGSFVQEDTFLHHNRMMDVRYEGIYAGSSHWERVLEDVDCGGVIRDVQEHELAGVRIHDNWLERIGNDGIQVGNAPYDVAIYRNRVIDVGRLRDIPHSSAIQIGGGTRAWVEGNVIRGAGLGVIVGGPGGSAIVNNVFHEVSGSAMVTQDNELLEPGTGYLFINNTVISSGTCEPWSSGGDTMCWCGDGRALCIYDTHGVDNTYVNNLIVDTLAAPTHPGLRMEANLEGMHCVDPEAGDYRLLEGSAAIDAGIDASPWGVVRDQAGALRSDGAYDIGALER